MKNQVEDVCIEKYYISIDGPLCIHFVWGKKLSMWRAYRQGDNGWVDQTEQTDGRTDRQTEGRTDGWTDKRMDRLKDRRTDGQTV